MFVIDINYDIEYPAKSKIRTNVNGYRIESLIENYLSEEHKYDSGKIPNKADTYRIKVSVDRNLKKIHCDSNCGSMALEKGILREVLRNIDKWIEK